MNPSDHSELDRMIAVMEASKTQKIECRSRGQTDWLYAEGRVMRWNWESCDYRVKPQEPRRAMVNIIQNEKFGVAYNPATEQSSIELAKLNLKPLAEFIELTSEVRQKLGL